MAVPDFLFFVIITCSGSPNKIDKNSSRLFYHLTISLFFGTVSAFLIYNIGFVILQSKAKNDVLSLVSAYTNPITLPKELVYSYGFVYSFLAVGAVLPVLFLYMIIQYLHNVHLPTATSKNKSKRYRVISTAALLLLAALGAVTLYFTITTGLFPRLVYFLLYRLTAPSPFEQLLENSAIQWGALGKNLAQFDNDYVCVEFAHPTGVEHNVLLGLRIAHHGNELVLRSLNDNSIHTITSDRMYVKTLLSKPAAEITNSCSM
ncbi:hypothetical protein [Cohnella panacarvi]|uniref:hypothetical protein n=1 Tax=Cohnella panacarvi TaxID=400776 RepID=UPI0004793658|nr:hypothetical protein [Cohnella panacarvi]